MQFFLFWLIFIMIVCLLSGIDAGTVGTAADCPPGFKFLGACLGNQCPTVADGTDTIYYCFRAADVCCGQILQQPPAPNNCVDGATNCIRFFGYCRQRTYYSCMAIHCRRTCGFCFG